MKKLSIIMFIILMMGTIAHAAIWMPVGTATGGMAVYYNSTVENPLNQAYLKAQINNSTTQTNGAAFAFDPALAGPALFNDLGQYGFDLVVTAPTSNGNVPTPVLNAYDNTNNSLSGRSLAGQVMWAINDYKDGGGGPGNSNNDIINSLIRGNSGTVLLGPTVTPINGGWQVSFTANLVSDGRFHWYNPAFTDNLMSAYPQNGQWWSGNFRASGTLTYLVANDTTAGMDFYSGPVTLEAEVVPEPATICMLGLGALSLMRKKK
jgi:hypothetical protein